MNPALFFLVRRSFVNAVRSRLRRLKEPRYLVPFVLGVLYFGGYALSPWMENRPAATGTRDRAAALAWEWGGAALTLLLLSGPWIFPSRGPALTFLEAEVCFLFPAPLRRRELIRYKVLDVQKYIVPSMLFFAVFFGLRGGADQMVRIFLGGFLVFNLLTLHQMGARLTRASLAEHGVSGWKRQAIVLAALAAVVAVAWFGTPPFPALESLPFKEKGEAILRWVEGVGKSPAGWALLPLRLPGMLFASPDLATFLLRSLPVAGLVVALYLWVVRCDAAFEEAAADHAQVIARKIELARKGRLGFSGEERKTAKGSLFRLAPAGPPETAFIWKSATELLRNFPMKLGILLLVAGMVALPIALDESRPPKGEGAGAAVPLVPLLVSVFFGMGAAFLALMGPTTLGSNLRTDLELVETLKTLPVTGARIVRSYLAGTVVPLAVGQAVLLVGVAIAFPQDPEGVITPAWRIAGAAAGILVLPMITAASALVDSAVALVFPAWFRPGQTQAQGGMEGMGVGILYMLSKVLCLGLGAGIPIALGAGVVLGAGFLGMPHLLPAAAIAGAALAAALILVEVVVACGMLGRRFEDLDPAKEGILP